MMKHLIWGKDEAKSFLQADWTDEISLKRFEKLVFRRKPFQPRKCCQRRHPDREPGCAGAECEGPLSFLPDQSRRFAR
jgi:hypothetical protein